MDASLSEKPPQKLDWRAIAQTMVRSPYFLPVAIFVVGLTVVYWPLLSYLYTLWTGPDGYYTHGFLVPLIVGYLVYRAWPNIKDRPIKPVVWPLIFLIPLLWIAYAARLAELRSVLSVGFVLTLLIGIWFLFGWKWMTGLLAPTLYLLFAFPIWSGFVTNYTNPLQTYSTSTAYKLLELFSHPIKTNSTTILVGNFWLDVGVPCSGLKLVLAITAFTCFFMLIGGLKWWGNALMVAIILPLCLFVNGLRIALIGIVGEHYGDKAGMQFHDYSGYLTLIVCFFLLFKFARLLGWKD
ncbi:MAG: exosortase/archaeosortase family protein [Fimbriimonadaceae bacterium]|nr:exosortase/archaeosortase family protein [Fimbriimonadaceae bacterium]